MDYIRSLSYLHDPRLLYICSCNPRNGWHFSITLGLSLSGGKSPIYLEFLIIDI
jgi:hypothetical protein